MTSSLIQPTSSTIWEYTYPHGSECFYILLPKQGKKKTFLSKLIENRGSNIISMIFLLFVAVRILFKRTPIHHWLNDFIVTLGIYLQQNVFVVGSDISVLEQMWLTALLGFSVITVALFATILYNIQLYEQPIAQINSIADFLKTNYSMLYLLIHKESISMWAEDK